MQDKITVVVDYLNEVKTRCTYNAAAKALVITPQALKKLLGARRSENSWLVSSGTGLVIQLGTLTKKNIWSFIE